MLELHPRAPDPQVAGAGYSRRFDGGHRQPELVLAAAHDQHRRASQLGRQRQDEARSLPRHALHLDLPVQRMDLIAHHVETDAASRNIGDVGARGEAGPEDQLMHLRGRHRRQLFGGRDTPAQRGLADAREIDAGTVVGHLDEEHVALLLDADGERTLAMLAGFLANFRHLHTVIDRVAHQVHQRPAQLFQHAAIERHFRPDHAQARELAGRLGQIAHRAPQRLDHRPHRHRRDGLEAVLHRRHDVGGLLAVRAESAPHAHQDRAGLGRLHLRAQPIDLVRGLVQIAPPLVEPQAHLAQPLDFVEQRDHLPRGDAPAGLFRGLRLFELGRLRAPHFGRLDRRLLRQELQGRAQIGQLGLRRRRAQPRHPRVERLEHRVGERRRQRLGRTAQRQDRVLHPVREIGQLVEAQRRRAAFQSVQAAGEIVEARALRRRVLQLDQIARDAFVDLLRLVDESGQQLLEKWIHHRFSRRSISSRRSSSWTWRRPGSVTSATAPVAFARASSTCFNGSPTGFGIRSQSTATSRPNPGSTTNSTAGSSRQEARGSPGERLDPRRGRPVV